MNKIEERNRKRINKPPLEPVSMNLAELILVSVFIYLLVKAFIV
jgi:hypothetical protein